MTMLEVVLAVVLLGLLSATFSFSYSYLTGSAYREEKRLGAAEVANRIMLQYLDDKNLLPSETLPVDYNGYRYRWSLDEPSVEIRLDEAAMETESERDSGIGLDRIRMIVVRAWLGEESGGSYVYSENVPSITVTRLFDPIGLEMRSPDSLERKFNTDAGIQDLIAEFMRMQGGTQSGSTGGGQP